jgi:fructokinase
MPQEGVVVVGGEALIDLVLAPDGALRAHSGGGPFNTARALGRLEQNVLYLGRISTDRFGARLRADLTEDGVVLDAVVDTDDPTTLAIAEIVPGLTSETARAVVPDDMAMLHVGTLGLVLEPVGTALADAAERAAGRALVMVDPNIRPVLIPDLSAYRARLGAVLRHTDVVKASDADLAWLEPGAGPAEAARALLADGPRVVLVTLGGAGALVVTESDAVAVPAPRVEVVDTIGAGDAFSGGFLAQWRMRGRDLAALSDLDAVAEAAEFACKVAALTCARPGASPPRLSEVA